jgi:predicted RNA binding protein YcfA (HicA-like mRNA interferase family)
MKAWELIRLLENASWREVRQSGSHKIFQHPDFTFNIIVPEHGSKDLGKGLVMKILKQAGLRK